MLQHCKANSRCSQPSKSMVMEHIVQPKNYANGLCFVVFYSGKVSTEFIYILRRYFLATGTIHDRSLKRKCCHFDEIFITGCTESCHFDNFRCSQWWRFHQNDDIFVSVAMTSSNGNIFCVTGPLCGEFTGDRWIPITKASVFVDFRLIKRLSKQSWGWWFETPSRSLWRHCNAHDYTNVSEAALKDMGKYVT